MRAGSFHYIYYPDNWLRVTLNWLSETKHPEILLNNNKLTPFAKPFSETGPWFRPRLFLTCISRICPSKSPCFLCDSAFACSLPIFFLSAWSLELGSSNSVDYHLLIMFLDYFLKALRTWNYFKDYYWDCMLLFVCLLHTFCEMFSCLIKVILRFSVLVLVQTPVVSVC